MKYLIWKNNNEKDKDNLLNVLLTNHSFAEIFEGDNPLYPVSETIRMQHERYQIARFEKVSDDMIEIEVVLVTGVSETA
ncbi:hypothetical protein [Nitrosopumilus sp.]|uniref:hypothetical protein n=1 Tax=Nitrosopumilus sp. TaxID=2024843 RepID=UPI00292E342E|nr:hypothetical protein [Nitrosopumilus sp.]